MPSLSRVRPARAELDSLITSTAADVGRHPSAGGVRPHNRDGVDSNARLSAGVGALLLAPLAAEGLTPLSVWSPLTLHVVSA
jgi:hypothetical protein